MKKTRDREADFDEFYSEIFESRWPALRKALLKEPRKIELPNPFGQGLDNYSLDEASTLPPRWLDVRPGSFHADFCASPGGKLLQVAFAQPSARFFASDLSSARVARLKAVLHDCVPAEVLSRFEVRLADASRWGLKFKDTFDSVLVDAPCSGERHLLASSKELGRWSKKSSQRLAVRQHALLCSGLDSLKSGGRLVYSTCALSPFENDGVIKKLLKSREGLFEVVKVDEKLGEPTDLGWIILPDRFDCGPIYFSVLLKK